MVGGGQSCVKRDSIRLARNCQNEASPGTMMPVPLASRTDWKAARNLSARAWKSCQMTPLLSPPTAIGSRARRPSSSSVVASQFWRCADIHFYTKRITVALCQRGSVCDMTLRNKSHEAQVYRTKYAATPNSSSHLWSNSLGAG